MKKGLIIQGYQNETLLCQFFVSTLFYVFLASFFIEGGLWLSSELVGPFSISDRLSNRVLLTRKWGSKYSRVFLPLYSLL